MAALPWQVEVRGAVLAAVSDFLDAHCGPALDGGGVDIAEGVLRDLLAEGKCLRSAFLYL
ncbi:MAG: geranylgeranyl diphosphate synthase, type, partial [Mycobacterium sp.]|nr:geranylgeranyl diphosphate synthase, type [Mycobacterium sp.]